MATVTTPITPTAASCRFNAQNLITSLLHILQFLDLRGTVTARNLVRKLIFSIQEQAPKTAMDKAEIISNTETMNTPAGNFTNVLKTEETTAMNLKEKEYKFYAPNIGLIKEGEMLLVKYGFVK